MPTYEQIQTQIQHLDNVSKFLGKRELKELPSILWEDEVVERIVQGLYGKGNGILVATNKRLVFVDKGLIVGLRVEDFPYDKISSIQYETGLLFGKLIIFTSGNRATIEQVDKKQCRDFGDYVRARITQVKDSHSAGSTTQHVASNNSGGTSTGNVVEQLEKLAHLKTQGILTEEEFQQQKRKILNG